MLSVRIYGAGVINMASPVTVISGCLVIVGRGAGATVVGISVGAGGVFVKVDGNAVLVGRMIAVEEGEIEVAVLITGVTVEGADVGGMLVEVGRGGNNVGEIYGTGVLVGGKTGTLGTNKRCPTRIKFAFRQLRFFNSWTEMP
jgi:hypothetical protein